MNRQYHSSLRSLAAAATTVDSATSSAAAAAMSSSRPYNFRGGHPQGRRGYCDRPSGSPFADHVQFVSGDSHFRAVQDANSGFRPPSYNAVPPPPQYLTSQQFYGPGQEYHRPGPPIMQQQFPGPHPYRQHRPVGPAFGNHQQFRPRQMPQQQLRPRPSKPQDYRDWEYAKPGPPPHSERFTVLSYNILADYLANDHWQKLYFHIPRHMLDWNWRKRSICFELGLWSADILCFQEVDRFHDIEAELRPHGYSGIWKMRTGDPADGCAIFWRDLRFKLVHEESIEYKKLGLRDNVAQICVFESLSGQNNSNGVSTLPPSSTNSNKVVVCNIHVLFNPKRGDVKLGQIRVLLDRAHAVSKLWDDAPVVICGDFNCTPKSPLYNFITEQKLDLSELPRDKISGQASAEIRPSRPAYPDVWIRPTDNSTQISGSNCEKPENPVILNNHSSDHTKVSVSTGNSDSDKSDPDPLPNSLDISSSESMEVVVSVSDAKNKNDTVTSCESASHESTSADFELGEKFEALALNESVDGVAEELGEDCDSFLSELHSKSDLDSGSNRQHLQPNGAEILNDSNGVVIDERAYFSSSSAWTPAEMESATGHADCKVMEHPLKLTSAYADVENSRGIRDTNGEPLITSYHRRFSGTVDYIWHSEGLQTAKVLAPIPKHVMQQTQGFPTKKWGSDHIALVSEFAFTKNISSESADR